MGTQILQLNVRLSISVPMMEKAASGPTVFSVLMELSSTRVSSFATGGSTSTAQAEGLYGLNDENAAEAAAAGGGGSASAPASYSSRSGGERDHWGVMFIY